MEITGPTNHTAERIAANVAKAVERYQARLAGEGLTAQEMGAERVSDDLTDILVSMRVRLADTPHEVAYCAAADEAAARLAG